MGLLALFPRPKAILGAFRVNYLASWQNLILGKALQPCYHKKSGGNLLIFGDLHQPEILSPPSSKLSGTHDCQYDWLIHPNAGGTVTIRVIIE
jgi:hypothetical protein